MADASKDPLQSIFLRGSLYLGLLTGLAYAVYVFGKSWLILPAHFFMVQDLPVLTAMLLTWLGMSLWLGQQISIQTGHAAFHRHKGANLNRLMIALAIIGVAILARLGRDWIFHGYSISRDELMVEMAGAYLAEGQIGWPIPTEWLKYRQAIVPEFFSPYGADKAWTAIYLPVHAAIRSLFVTLGDANWAAPVTLIVGLVALWHNARRLLGTDQGAVAIVMMLALTSSQLVVTAMTPYAMTSHFAFNMLWLACVLRGGVAGHALAAVVAVAAGGLHQWHFPALFILPYVLWFALRRQWGLALWHFAALCIVAFVWARLYPMLLIDVLGPPPPVEAHRTNGVFDKLLSLVGRLDDWQPLLNIPRLIAWNNLLLLPLAVLAILPLFNRWRSLLVDPPIILPMALGVTGGLALALYQGYGWGFRYMAGQIGTLCLLGGFGWQSLRSLAPPTRKMLVGASVVFTVGASLWQMRTTEQHVRGYAASMTAIRDSDADVVFVDYRRGYFMTDLVRFQDGRPGRPVVMALHMLSTNDVEALCSRYRVKVMDAAQFNQLGVPRLNVIFPGETMLNARRALMANRGCDTPVLDVRSPG